MSAGPLSRRGDFSFDREKISASTVVPFLNSKCGRIDLPRPEETSARLAKMVEAQIIPRLMRAHRPQVISQADGPLETILDQKFIDAFTLMVLSNEVEELLGYFQDLTKSVLNTELLYFEFLSATARRLGDYWNEDKVCQAEMTIGLGRLQQLVRMMGAQASAGAKTCSTEQSAYVASCPGEPHSFGLALIDYFFQRSGWNTSVEPAATGETIARVVQRRWFDLFCLNASSSLSCDAHLETVASTIKSVRRVSKNRDITVIVGGRIFHEYPELASSVGADTMVSGESVALLMA